MWCENYVSNKIKYPLYQTEFFEKRVPKAKACFKYLWSSCRHVVMFRLKSFHSKIKHFFYSLKECLPCMPDVFAVKQEVHGSLVISATIENKVP